MPDLSALSYGNHNPLIAMIKEFFYASVKNIWLAFTLDWVPYISKMDAPCKHMHFRIFNFQIYEGIWLERLVFMNLYYFRIYLIHTGNLQ